MKIMTVRRQEDLLSVPEGVVELGCYGSDIKHVPKLPSSLNTLRCTGCEITELPDLPHGLESLLCNSCEIAELPDLPPTLKHLECEYNCLDRLPTLPEGLISLKCYGNRIQPKEIPETVQVLQAYCPIKKIGTTRLTRPFIRSRMTEIDIDVLLPWVPACMAEGIRDGSFEKSTAERALRSLLRTYPDTALVRWHWLSGFLHLLGAKERDAALEKASDIDGFGSVFLM